MKTIAEQKTDMPSTFGHDFTSTYVNLICCSICISDLVSELINIIEEPENSNDVWKKEIIITAKEWLKLKLLLKNG